MRDIRIRFSMLEVQKIQGSVNPPIVLLLKPTMLSLFFFLFSSRYILLLLLAIVYEDIPDLAKNFDTSLQSEFSSLKVW